MAEYPPNIRVTRTMVFHHRTDPPSTIFPHLTHFELLEDIMHTDEDQKAFQRALATVVPIEQHAGSKYLRRIHSPDGKSSCLVDVYSVTNAFEVGKSDPSGARFHAIKKLLCAGLRGKGSIVRDLIEARDALDRDIQMQLQREQSTEASE